MKFGFGQRIERKDGWTDRRVGWNNDFNVEWGKCPHTDIFYGNSGYEFLRLGHQNQTCIYETDRSFRALMKNSML